MLRREIKPGEEYAVVGHVRPGEYAGDYAKGDVVRARVLEVLDKDPERRGLYQEKNRVVRIQVLEAFDFHGATKDLPATTETLVPTRRVLCAWEGYLADVERLAAARQKHRRDLALRNAANFALRDEMLSRQEALGLTGSSGQPLFAVSVGEYQGTFTLRLTGGVKEVRALLDRLEGEAI